MGKFWLLNKELTTAVRANRGRARRITKTTSCDFSSLAVVANVSQPSVDRGSCGSPLIGQVDSVHCDVRVVIE